MARTGGRRGRPWARRSCWLRARETATLAEAVAGCTLVAGTGTLNRRKPEQRVVGLPELAPLVERELERGGRVGLVFGPEKHGLTREDLSYCHLLVEIPTDARQPSMNLGQAVAVCLYEVAARAFGTGSSVAGAGLGGEMPDEHPSGAKKAAEKGQSSDEIPEKRPSGAKAPVDFLGFTRGLKPPSPSGAGLSAACKAHDDPAGPAYRLKPVPFSGTGLSADAPFSGTGLRADVPSSETGPAYGLKPVPFIESKVPFSETRAPFSQVDGLAAASDELDRLAEWVEEAMLKAGYSPLQMREANRHDLRLLLRRLALTKHDTRRILGLFRRILWRLGRDAKRD